MGRPDGLLRYMTHLLLMTFVACHPFPFCDLDCHFLLSLSSRAEMPPKNNLKKKRNKTTTENYPWQVSEVLQKCLASHSNFSSPPTPVSQSSMVLWRQSIDLREQLEAAVMWSVACYIVQISKADIWYPGRGSGVKSWHINWTECMHVTKMTLSWSAESH